MNNKNLIFLVLIFFNCNSSHKNENTVSENYITHTQLNKKESSPDIAKDFLQKYAVHFSAPYNDFYVVRKDTIYFNDKNWNLFKDSLQMEYFFTQNFISQFENKLKVGSHKSVEDEETMNYDYFLITQEPEYYIEKIRKNEWKEKKSNSMTNFIFAPNDIIIFALKNQKIDSIYRERND